MPIETVRRAGGHWERADEVDERQFVERLVVEAHASRSVRCLPRSFFGEEVHRLVATIQGIALVLEKSEREAAIRIEPGGALAGRADQCDSDSRIEAKQIGTRTAYLGRAFNPHCSGADLSNFRNSYSKAKFLTDREWQIAGLCGLGPARAHGETGKREQA